MADLIIIEPYNPEWVDQFKVIARTIRLNMGELATRIDHIGSTSIVGLDAKPIIDIQVSVKSFEPFESIKHSLVSAGYVHRPDNEELTKRYFRESNGQKRTHIHVRIDGHWSQRFPLLFRDYMRRHKEDCKLYSDLKHELSLKYQNDRKGYVESKDKLIWEIMRRADRWAQETGWINGNSDY